MSYDIDTFHVKELKNFSVPLDLLAYDYRHQERGWNTKLTVTIIDGVDRVNCDVGIESEGIDGVLDFETRTILVDSIRIYGEGSGTAYHEILFPLFAASTGKLRAIIVWAGGDSVQMLSVNNGEVTEINMLE